MVRACATGGQEPGKEGPVGPCGGCQQLDVRARGELHLAPPEPGSVAAASPGSAEDAAEQIPAAGAAPGVPIAR